MTEQPHQQSGAGKTAGLPGQNADPATAELSDETVAMGDVAPVPEAPDR